MQSPLLTGLVLVIVGLIGVFWGYRVFRILLPLYGAVAGYLVAYHWLGQSSVFLALVVGVVLAVLFALIAYLYWSVLVTIGGVILGIGVASVIAGSLNLGNFLFYILALVFAIVGGWLLWKIRDEFIIILTVLFGAGAAAEGVGLIFGLQPGFAAQAQQNPLATIIVAVVWIVLVVAGLMWQWPRYRHLGLYGFGGPVPQPAAAPPPAAKPVAAAAVAAPAATRGGEGVSVAGAAAVGATAAAVASKQEEPPAPAPEAAPAEAAGDMGAGAMAAAGAVAAGMADEGAEPVPMAAEEPEPVSEEQVGQIIDQIEQTYGLEDVAKFKESLDFVEGVGPAYAEKLRAAGVLTVLDLLRRGATRKGRADLAEETGITGKLILRWVNHADLYRVKGVGAEYADLLEAAGVDTVVELAQRNPGNLLNRMLAVNEEKKLVRKTPFQSQVDDWVAQAKGLERIIQY